jgi:hypothetical protein
VKACDTCDSPPQGCAVHEEATATAMCREIVVIAAAAEVVEGDEDSAEGAAGFGFGAAAVQGAGSEDRGN